MSLNFLKLLKLLLIFALVLSCSTTMHAASFDCSKASSKIEKAICANSALSKLDQDLGTLFNSVKIDDTKIVSEQKKWLLERRNICKDTDCLINEYNKRIDELKTRKVCLFKDNYLMGSWMRIKGGFFEEMSFSVDNETNVFFSWIDHHPEMAGTWMVSQCRIQIISNSDEKMQFDFKVKKIEKDKLYIFDSETNMNAIYKKIQISR